MIDWVIFAFELGTNSTTIVLTHFMCKNSWVQFQKLGIFGEIGYKETQRSNCCQKETKEKDVNGVRNLQSLKNIS